MDPITMAIAGAGKGLLDVYGREKKRQAEKRALSGQLDALNNLAKVTPSERDYVARRRRIMEHGDPLLKDEFNRQAGTIRQEGQFARQRAQGQVIQQGLEGSIVAQELRRKVDKDVLTSVAEQARELAKANALAKRRAEGELEQMNLKTDARKQETAYKSAVVKGQIDALGDYGWDDRLMALAGMGLGGLEGYSSGLSLASKLKSSGYDTEGEEIS